METTPVVLLHGMWSTGRTLDPVRVFLEARGHRVLSPTLPLHPARSKEEHVRLGRLSLLDYARHLEEAILAARLPTPPVLVGHSMGGLLAQMLASRLTTRALVLLAPAPPAGIQAVRWRNLLATRNVLLTPGFWKRAHRPATSLADWALLNGVPEPRRSAVRAELLHESGRAYAEIVFWWLDRANASYVASAQVRCPTLVMTGAQDRVIPPSVVRKVAALYPQAETLVLPERGHWFFEEDGADEILARLAGWLELACAATEPNGALLRAAAAPDAPDAPAAPAEVRPRIPALSAMR